MQNKKPFFTELTLEMININLLTVGITKKSIVGIYPHHYNSKSFSSIIYSIISERGIKDKDKDKRFIYYPDLFIISEYPLQGVIETVYRFCL